jgi:deoxyribodipyrimidine photolyase-related protein
MAGIYLTKGSKLRNSNYFNHQNKLNNTWYEGTTSLPPIDLTIKKVNKLGYAHHIERLMILGNAMLLCEIHPKEVYKWFMERFIDSYDWVMVPNVYGMSQYSNGGSIVTKPYISSSNYICKMSDFKRTEPWCDIWDSLFWRFLDKNKEKVGNNPRIKVLYRHLEKKNMKEIYSTAEQFIEKVTK